MARVAGHRWKKSGRISSGLSGSVGKLRYGSLRQATSPSDVTIRASPPSTTISAPVSATGSRRRSEPWSAMATAWFT